MTRWIHPHDVGLCIGLVIGAVAGLHAETWAGAAALIALSLVGYFTVDRLIARIKFGDWLYQPSYPGFPPDETEGVVE